MRCILLLPDGARFKLMHRNAEDTEREVEVSVGLQDKVYLPCTCIGHKNKVLWEEKSENTRGSALLFCFGKYHIRLDIRGIGLQGAPPKEKCTVNTQSNAT